MVDVHFGPNQRPARYDDSNWRENTSGSLAGSDTSVCGRDMRPVAMSIGSLPNTLHHSRRAASIGALRTPSRAAPVAASLPSPRRASRAAARPTPPAPFPPIRFESR